MSSTPRHVTLAVLGPVLALLLAGCADGGSAPSAATTPAGRSTAPAASPSSSAKSPAAGETTAADGRNLDACSDRRCEVLVEQGDVIRFAAKYEADTFTVVQLSGGGLRFEGFDDRDVPFRGLLSGTGTVSFGDVTIEVTPRDGEHVVLRVRPRQN